MDYLKKNWLYLSGLCSGQSHEVEYLHRPSEAPRVPCWNPPGPPWWCKVLNCAWRKAQGFLFFMGMCSVKTCVSLKNKNDKQGCRISWILLVFECFPPFHQEFTPLLVFIVNFSDWGLEIAQNLQHRTASENRKKKRKAEGWREVSRQFCKANRVLSFLFKMPWRLFICYVILCLRTGAYEELSCTPQPPWLLYCSQGRFIKFWINMC